MSEICMPDPPDGYYWNVAITSTAYQTESRVTVVCYKKPLTSYGVWRHRRRAKFGDYWYDARYMKEHASSPNAERNADLAVELAQEILNEHFPTPVPPRSLNGLVGYGVPEVE